MTSKYDKRKELSSSKSKPCYKIDLNRTGVALYTECTYTILVVEVCVLSQKLIKAVIF